MHIINDSMLCNYKNQYVVIDSEKPGPLYVAPHSGVAFQKPGDYQDEGTHHIAYKLAMDGGRALISLISRERDIGLDLYRQPPNKRDAINDYSLFQNSYKETFVFRKEFSWVARDENEHMTKQGIYNSFWGEIKNNRAPVFFIHRQFLNPIRHPSVLDVIPFNYESKVKRAVNYVNKKNTDLLDALFPMYKKSFEFKTQCILFKKKIELTSDLHLFRGKTPKIRKRMKKFSAEIDRNPCIRVTYMKNFNGDVIRPVVKRKMNTSHPIIQFEISEFLTNRYPDIAVYIIRDIINRL